MNLFFISHFFILFKALCILAITIVELFPETEVSMETPWKYNKEEKKMNDSKSLCKIKDFCQKRFKQRSIKFSFRTKENKFYDSISSSVNCHQRLTFRAFGERFTLCLFLSEFVRDSIIREGRNSLVNATVFGKGNNSENISLESLHLKFAHGFVEKENFSSVSGFIMEDHFYGNVMMKDTIHYLEPYHRKSLDMQLIGKDLKILSVKHNTTLKAQRPTKRKRKFKRRLCEVSIFADHHFFREIGGSSVHKTILQILWHIKEASALLQSKDFDNDGQSECIGFTVSKITIFKSEESALYELSGNITLPEDFLKRFSRYNFDGDCLGILFTNRAFHKLVLGLSWRGNLKAGGVGGVCQDRVRIKSEDRDYSFNTLFVTLKSSQENRIPLRMGVLNLVHEILHSFGAKHDPDPLLNPKCSPRNKWYNGRYLMSKFSNTGQKVNHDLLSPCTKALLVRSLFYSDRTQCLIEGKEESFCGDGVIQRTEECDCGTRFQCHYSRSCCIPQDGYSNQKPCTLNKDLIHCI